MNENVPIIGQPAAVLQWYPTALVHCKCQAERGLMTIIITTGFNNPAGCPHCGKLYSITGLQQKPDGVHCVLGVILPTPTKGVM